MLLWVSHPDLTGGASALVSPLLWAAGTGNDDAVRMLLGMGHDMTRGSDRYAVCLARAAGKTSTAELLLTHGNQPGADCHPPEAGKPLLTALLQNSPGRLQSGEAARPPKAGKRY